MHTHLYAIFGGTGQFMHATKTRCALFFTLLFFLALPASVAIGRPSGQVAKAADYSKEPFVLEKVVTKIVVENDGTYTSATTARMRIQSQAGVKQFGMITFPYASATSTLDIVYVRVTKPDNRVVETPAENVLDMPADITREAPFYSDLKEKQVAVKGLEIGDILEYEYRNSVKNPLAPGQFWLSFNFEQMGICLEETWQVSIPRGRYVKVESPKLSPTTAEQGAYTVYTWKTSHLESDADKKDSKSADSDEPSRPSVQITSFRDWDELGQWFRSLVVPRIVPTPPIQAKADELTRNERTDSEKIQALYNYVSKNFRYIGISLGIGRYQPHAAADVLSNDYGDCKDKHTLFAALLAAEHINAYPALVSSTSEIDSAMPSPSQFDHMITAIPQADGFLFLDTTPEVGPFGFLVEAVRGKQVLVVPDSGPSTLVKTPDDPPFKSFFHFQADGALDDKGTFEGKMQMSLRGDAELAYRLAFRNAGQPQWNDVMQRISSNLGFGGTVSDVTISAPDATDAPFQIDYAYTRKDYGDWENRHTISPFPPVFVPPAPDKDDKPMPVKLGTPVELLYEGSIRLPANSHPNSPATIDLQEPFADYHSSYTFSNGSLHFVRRLTTKAREVAPAQIEAYRKFVKAIVDDTTTFISLAGEETPSPEFAGTPEARVFYQQGSEAWQQRNMRAAADAFQKAVDKDPKFAQAWLWLGAAHVYSGDVDDGIDEMKKSIALDPAQISSYKFLASTLMAFRREDDALQVWIQLEKQSPSDTDAVRNIVSILLKQKRYSEALPELESAVKSSPDDANLLLQLGDVYFHAGDKVKAVAVLHEAIDKSPNALTWNDAAYTLADNNVMLQDALQYAQKAVNDIDDKTLSIGLDDLELQDIQMMPELSAYWDTLGWVHFRLGHLELAEKYLHAAWSLSQDQTVGDHLQQVYDKMAKRNGMAWDKLALQDARTVKLGKLVAAKHVHAEFFVLFSNGSKVEGVKFISGAEELRGAGKALSAAKFDVPFPDDNPTQILRRGILDCEPELPGCVFVLIPPNDVRSIK